MEVINIINNNLGLYNLIVSIISAIISLVGVCYVYAQIKINNKCKLFESRKSFYSIFYKLYYSYEQNMKFMVQSDEYPPMGICLTYLTNFTYLEGFMKAVIDSQKLLEANLENKDKKEYEQFKKVILMKLEDLDMYATEAEFLWNKKYATDIALFITSYRELLNALRNYIIEMVEVDKKRNAASTEARVYKNTSEEDFANQQYKQQCKEWEASRNYILKLCQYDEKVKALADSFRKLQEIDVLNKMKEEIKLP